MTAKPRIVAVAPGPPRSLQTFSGISLALLEALERRGASVAAVDGRTSLLALVEKAASFAPERERWKQRYNAGASALSPLIRRAMSRIGRRRASAAAPDADVLLQMTGYFDPGHPGAVGLRCSYHDGNLAGFLRRPDLVIDPNGRWVTRALAYERGLYDSIDLIFTMSDRLRDSFISDFGQAPAKVVTVGAGANLAVITDPIDRSPTPPRMLFVGKQFERKGGPVVVEAFRRLRAEHPDAELWIVGPEALDLESSVPGVRLYGHIARDEGAGDRELAGIYAGATAFVMPSLYEPFGIAFVEAMAHRLPCIGSTGGAIPELVEEGVTGFLVEAGDVDGLLDRMRRLAADPELAGRMGDAGFERYRTQFTWDAVADRMLAAMAARVAEGGPDR